ncbi:gliding motility-associated C-terminal domain-containing protein [Paracrocinitomix mangrovi]|uniref:T9SS type B sorting domain-containing protein n=1 Tax=Paracrocinitomix mangrovi TaxID=2862509 RepID=UPI001C8DACA2|nr:gliding motility-associated C-terminal domain-containing protein [Paracrocinitomix mangrovi]UKN01010.1 gliding motility-associated C-terminal domain-containing protein [Paracrocinitomix mangrovi]
MASVANAQGNWLRSIGDNDNEEVRDATFDSNGDYVMTGFFTGTLNTGVGTLTTSGNTDIFIIKTNDAGNPIWAVQAGGSGVDRANGIASDAAGNTYITGYFQSSATFGSITVSGQGWEAYVAKIDPNGNFVWVSTMGGSNGDIGYGIDVDNSGNVFCVGEFTGNATFGASVFNSMNGTADVFVSKLDNNGTFLWTKVGQANAADKGFEVTTDNTGNAYVIGQFSNNITFDVTHSTTLLNAGFLIKFDASGNEQWFDHLWGAQILLNDVEWRNNKVFITGDYQSNVLVQDVSGIQNFNGTGNYNILTARFSSTGQLDWLSSNYSDSELHSKQLCIDSNNDVYLTGDFLCTFTEMNATYGNSTFLSVGYEDVHFIKYNFAGAFQWARQMASNGPDFGVTIDIKNPNLPVIAGAHEGTFYVPAGGSFAFLPGQQTNFSTSNCSDANYGNFAKENCTNMKDIFWTSPFDINRLPFDYFEKNPGLSCDLNTYPPCIGNEIPFANCEDTLSGCAPVTAWLNDFFYDGPSPNYSVSWSNGGSGTSTGISVEGNYTATTTTVDGCYTWTDNVYIEIYPDPDPPLISDSWFFNDNEILPNEIDTCDADSVLVWASPNGTGIDSLIWIGDLNELNDSTISVSTSGIYSAYAVNQYGCQSNTTSIDIVINNFALHDTLDPVIIFGDPDIQQTDSVLTCDLPFCSSAFLLDSNFTNIWGTMPNLYSVWTLDGDFLDTLQHNSDDTAFVTIPTNISFCVLDTGWHVLEAHLVNECGDTVDYFLVDQFYVDTVQTPYVSISGPTNACPGDTITVYADFYTNTANWSGSSIIANYGDSVHAVYNYLTGITITVSVDTTQEGTTCYNSATYGLGALPIPQVTMNPSDGVVCPGDSVQLEVIGGVAWQWIGPTGDSLGTNQIQYATDVGEYFCYVTTAEGCIVPSEFVETVAYSSPTLYIWNPVICMGDSTLIQVLGPNSTVINWLPPLFGSTNEQWVDSAGYYYVETSFCGITKIDSIELDINLPLENFNFPPDTLICPYDVLTLNAPPGMLNYSWNGTPGGDSFLVQDSGYYYLSVTDVDGCMDHSDTIYIGYHALPDAPVATDTTVCPGGDAVLSAVGTGTIDWYDSGFNHLQTGGNWSVSNVTPNQFYLVTQSDANCASLPDTASIFVFVDNVVADFDILDQCGSLTVQVVNTGNPGLDYSWDMGDGTLYNGDSIFHTYPGNGTYTVSMLTTDPVCGFEDSTVQDVTVYGQSVDVIYNYPTCYQFSDGSVTLDLIDGVGGETFLIEDILGNTLNTSGSNTANNLSAGWYYWEVYLGPGCTLMDSVEVVDPGALDANVIVFPPLCYGLTGSAMVDTVFNWQGDYNNISFFWNPSTSPVGGVWADSAYNMTAGDYVLTINDDNGCSNQIDFTVTEPPPLVFSELGSDPAYCRMFDYQSGNGVVYAAASGGTPDYTYQWVNLTTGDTTVNTTWGGLNYGEYQITVVDDNGCTLIDTVMVDSLNPEADFDMASAGFTVEWEGDSPLEVQFSNLSSYYANPNNPNADTTFFWHFDHPNDPPGWVISHDVNETFDTIYTAGTYTICLVAMNKNGCSDTTCQVIVVHDPVDLDPVNIFTPNGDGDNDVFTFILKSQGIETFECLIVNRWGVTVKELYDIYDSWDGTDKNGDDCPDGVYFYVYRGVGFNGTEFEGQGSITIVRGGN